MEQIIADTYRVIGKIGGGGGGTVWLAEHLRLGKKVILKADKRKITTRPELLRREVDVLKNLHHPYIPQVYDFFAEDGIVYTAMDYIEGESLDRPLRRGETFPQATVIKWARELLQALDYLHSPTHGDPPRGYTHSDIKPANLMRTPQNDVVLIDFNIALALGEANVIGRSAGYASPEHYGLDYTENEDTVTVAAPAETVYVPSPDITAPAPPPGGGTGTVPGTAPQTGTASSRVKVVTPDVRSDIYSVGATLYHLLSGRRPAANAKEVDRLPDSQFSPQVVAIIAKAMQPNPDRRYQTAAEMLDALEHLWENDPRTKRLKRQRRIAGVVCGGLFALGAASAFVGLKRMQTTEEWLKLAEYSANALQAGDREAAIATALEALPAQTGPLTPPLTAQAQKALTDALAVYDLADGYKLQGTVELPSAPLALALAPNGATAACLYSGALAVADTADGHILATLPADGSALAGVRYLNADVLLFSGAEGLQAYDIAAGKILWTGAPATAIALSADGRHAAALYRDETRATVYATADGTVEHTVDFGQRCQRVAFNDIFMDPHDDLFALSADGTLLAASFADGSLELFNLAEPDAGAVIYDADSGFTHFEGGFSGRYFAFSASNAAQSVFAAVDTATMEQTGGFEDTAAFGVQADESGIYVQSGNILVRVDPVTGGQTPLVTTPKAIRACARAQAQTLIATDEGVEIYNAQAAQIAAFAQEYPARLLALANGVALAGNREEPVLRLFRYENHPESEVFTYDPAAYPHDETRLSADGKTVMQFSVSGFRIYDMVGAVAAEKALPDSGRIYDQQFRRQGGDSWLEVTWYDGTVECYSAADGTLLDTRTIDPPDKSLYEEFFVKDLRIESPLHGTPAVYRAGSGRKVADLAEDAYLTYVSEAGPYIVTQYVTTEGAYYGQLLNERCEVLADLPCLCDVAGQTLVFDYPSGNVRQSRIYDIDSLRTLSHTHLTGGMTR